MTESLPIDKKNFDFSVSPKDSFYRHVNGNWLKDNEIPADKSTFNAFVTLDELSKVNLKSIFDGLVTEPEGKSLIAELYISGMDTEAIEKAGIEPIADLIAEIEAVQSVESAIKIVAKLHREAGVSVLFNIYSYTNARNSGTEALHGAQGGLGLPDRDYYFGEKEKEVQAYKDYVSKLFVLAGESVENANVIAQKVFAFEKKIAEFSLKQQDLRDPIKTYNKVTLDELDLFSPVLLWHEFFKGISISNFGDVIIQNIPYFTSLSQLIGATELDVLKFYLKVHLLDGFAPYLGEKWANAHFDYNAKALQGTKEQRPRWKRVIDQVSGNLRDEVGKAYALKFFPASSKKACEEMVGFITKAFEQRIKTVEWMQPETKRKALLKLS